MVLRERAKELFQDAIARPDSERAGFLKDSCGSDVELLHQIDDLLAAHAMAGQFLIGAAGAGRDEPNVGRTIGCPAKATPNHTGGEGSLVGRYRLLQRIGEGGFGEVWMAEQTEPVTRRVAVKIIKPGMDSRQIIARFESERQTLALMDHQNIARVFDAGSTENARPYFVMELVHGEPVTQYCDQHRLSITQRLRVFLDVCRAVQHAHQKGIIHRDLKPGNILVTVADDSPVPKVIDFGIARATSGACVEPSKTEQHALVGTPAYMSPEQSELGSADIDTRSDIYSLGVILYELLAGTTPLEGRRLRSLPFAEIQKLIREEDPPRPSRRLATISPSSANLALQTSQAPANGPSDSSAIVIARRRGAAALPLTRRLRGDLDCIVMKCLEKDRGRRYETAAALAEDIGRHLAYEPVHATPPSATYRLRKMVRRNRGFVLAASLIAATLIVATGVSIGFALKTSTALAAKEKQTKLAERSAAETQQVAEFQQAQLADIEPELMGKRLRDDLLAEARLGMERAGLSPQQTTERHAQLAALLADVNSTNVALHSLDQNIFERALRVANERFGDQPGVKAQLLQTLAGTLVKLGMFDKAEAPQAEALAIRRRILRDEDPATLRSIEATANLRMHQGRFPEAETHSREALRSRISVLGADNRETLESMNGLGESLLMQDKREEAEALFRDLLDRHRRLMGADDPGTLLVINNMGGLLYESGKLAEAEALFREGLERKQRVLGSDHEESVLALSNLALAIEKQGRLAEAEPLYREAFERSRRTRGGDHRHTLLFMSNLGFLLCTLNDPTGGEPFTRDALERRRELLGNDHWETMQSMHNMGILRQAQGKFDDAERYLREAIERRSRVLGDSHPATLQSLSAMAALLRKSGRLEEALLIQRQTLDKRRESLGDDHPDTLESFKDTADLLVDLNKPEEAP